MSNIFFRKTPVYQFEPTAYESVFTLFSVLLATDDWSHLFLLISTLTLLSLPFYFHFGDIYDS